MECGAHSAAFIRPRLARSPKQALSTSRRLLQRERLLLFDVGVRNAIIGLHRHRLPADQIGGVFEQWMMLQVLYLNAALRKGWRISTYRTESGAEVDLVIEREDDVIALEIKAGRQVTPADKRGLLSFEQIAGDDRPIHKWLVYRGERPQRFESGVDVLPVADALARLAQ